MMIAGLLLVAAALLLSMYNMREERAAESAAGDVLGQLLVRIAEGTPEPERVIIPDAPVSTAGVQADEMPEDAEATAVPPGGDVAAGVSPMPTMEALPAFVRNPDIAMPVQKVDGNAYIGVLEIPSLGLSLPVISEWNYPRLRIAPCRYTGSVYSRDIVISGHNYERHFGQLKLLTVGEEIRFTDADGNIFYYSVCGTEQLGKYDVYEMKNGDWDLTMFTCTYGGKNRVTVRCKLERYECP